jgi:hypothetical protein
VEVLKEALAVRNAEKSEAYRSSPRWESALFLLDKLGLRETDSIGLVLALLEDKPLSVNKATAAVRALGRHANAKEALEPIRQLLRRSDIDSILALQQSHGVQDKPGISDRSFILELAAAQALGKFGAKNEAVELAKKHVVDSRALVRNHARQVFEELGAA